MERLSSELDPSKFRSLSEVYDYIRAEHGELNAYSCFGKTLTYAEWDGLAERFAAYLHHVAGLKPGDRIAIQLPNLLQFPVALLGAVKSGLVVVNTNPLYTAHEMAHQFKDSEVKAIVILASFCAKLESIIGETKIETVIVADLGDLQPTPRRLLLNAAAKYVKRAVPGFELAGSVAFRDCINFQGPELPGDLEKGADDEVALILYTGGTTGFAKGAMLSHNNLIANMMQLRSRCLMVIADKIEKIAAPLPLYHSYAFLLHCLAMPYAGNQNLLIPNPRDLDSVVALFAKYSVSGFVGINTLYLALLQNEKFRALDFSSIRFCGAGGMPMSTSVAKQWHELTGVEIFEGYGLTECSPVVSVNMPGKVRLGTVGQLVPETEIKVVDEHDNEVRFGERGEAWIRGPQVMLGYWGQEQASRDSITDEGWFKTGDYVEVSDDGYITIVDRKKDMILVSGFNVFPNEIEDWVDHHPDVLESAAIGVPDERTGERIKLFVVSKSGQEPTDSIVKHCKEGLTAYKIPREIVYVEDLPKSIIGKILRRELK
jgi:long-chain acyl-CoA synthetase